MKTTYLRRILFVLGILCLQSNALFAHETLVGTVLASDSKVPVWGATVQINGTSKGTITNEQGMYTLICDSLPESLFITYLGFEPQFIAPILGERTIVSLKRSSLKLQEISVLGTTGSVSQTLSNLDLELKPVNSSQEVLRSIPGLFIGQHAGGGKAEQIFLRGYDIDHGTDINIQVDGMPVNMVSHAHGQGYADLHFLIPELIGKVDFDKGPYFAEQGNFATAGFVKFSTLEQLDKNRVQVEAGSFKTFRVLGMVNLLPSSFAEEKKQSAYLATEYLTSDGPFESPQDFQRFNIFYKHKYTLNDKNFLKVQASHFRSSWNASGQIPESAVEQGIISRFGAIDADEGGQTQRTNVALQLNSYLGKKSVVKSQVYYSNYNFTLFSNFTFFLEDSINGDRIKQQENRNIFGGNTTYEYNTLKNGVKYTSSIGTGVRYDMVDDNELAHILGRDSILEQYAFGNIDETNYSLYASQSFGIKKWKFILGARLDYFNFRYQDKLQNEQQFAKSAATFNPKLATIYNATEQFQIYLNLGTGFHSNDTRSAIYANTTKDILPKVYGADLGTNSKLGKKVLLSVAAWTLYQENELVYVGDAGIVEANGQSLRAGLDVSARIELLPWLFAETNLNYTHARSLGANEGENYIPLAASFTSTGGLFVKHKSGINGSLQYRHIGDRPANEDYSLTAKGYTLLDCSISYTQKKYEIGFVVQNLLNSEWREAQFETESQINAEASITNEIHFTPGSPINFKGKVAFFF